MTMTLTRGQEPLSWVTTVVALLLVSNALFSSVGASSPYSPDFFSWPVYGGNTAHTSFSNVQILKNTSSGGVSAEVIPRWNVSLSPGDSSQSFALTAGVVYANVYAVCQQNLQNVLYLIDALDGSFIHNVTLPPAHSTFTPSTGGNSLDNGLVYVQQVGVDEGVTVRAYDIQTGLKVWVATGSGQWPNYPYGTTPAANHILYAPGGEYNGEMYAYDADTGASVFQSQVVRTAFGCDYWAPTFDQEDDRVFFNTQPGEGNSGLLGEVDPMTGDVLWSVTLTTAWDGYSTMWLPVYDAESQLIYVSNWTQGYLSLGAVDVSASKKKSDSNASPVSPTPPVDALLECIPPAYNDFTGSFVDYSASTDGDSVFVTCNNGVHHYQMSTKNLVRVYSCQTCAGQPIVTADAVIVNSVAGVVVFDKQSGQLVQQFEQSGALALTGRALIITDITNNEIYCFDFVI